MPSIVEVAVACYEFPTVSDNWYFISMLRYAMGNFPPSRRRSGCVGVDSMCVDSTTVLVEGFGNSIAADSTEQCFTMLLHHK